MRFVDLLNTTVLVSAASATLLGAIAVLSAASQQESAPLAFALAWWLAAGVIGAYLGRKAETSPPIARLLAGARSMDAASAASATRQPCVDPSETRRTSAGS